MRDLISRQAAIDAIFSEPLYESGMKKRDADAVVPAIYEKIKSLPSAEPKTPSNGSITSMNPENTHDRTMGDLISRQNAIDAVEFGITYAKAIDVNTGESKELFKEGNDALKKAVERLKELPSTEPEIIRCKDCKWFGEAGCAVMIVDDLDKPTEDDYCSFAERKEKCTP